jgi:hypothetical protein
MADDIIPILLLPQHVTPSPSHLPLLQDVQKILNESYTKTYCAHPEIFGTTHLRLADPAQLADIIGQDGFTIVLFRTLRDDTKEAIRLGEMVATGSVKNFGTGDVESYAQWSQNLGGAQWVAKNTSQPQDQDDGKRAQAIQKYEVTAFAVSPHCQSRGLGARVLQEIEWLVSACRPGIGLPQAITQSGPKAEDVRLSSAPHGYLVEGLDLTKLKEEAKTGLNRVRPFEHNFQKPKLVLMTIRELSNEAYYQRRGFKIIWSGSVPVGMWDCKKECTMVYMEREI